MPDHPQVPAIPPPLPRSVRVNLRGAAALAVAAGSAGTVAEAVRLWQEHAHYSQGFPPGVLSGGAAFSLNFYPFAITLLAFALGVAGAVLLTVSCWRARDERRKVLTGLHLGTGVLLLPFFYLCFVFVCWFF